MELLFFVLPAQAFKTVEEAKAYFEKHQDDELPVGYALPISVCGDDEGCIASYAEMLGDLQKAYKKNYQAQRNVAYCLWDGCQGSVQKDIPLGCAWTVVILASGSPKFTELDQKNLEQCLRHAGQGSVGVIKAQAAALFQTIYERDIPSDWQ